MGRIVFALLDDAIEARRQGQLAVLLVLEHGAITMNRQVAGGQVRICFRGTVELDPTVGEQGVSVARRLPHGEDVAEQAIEPGWWDRSGSVRERLDRDQQDVALSEQGHVAPPIRHLDLRGLLDGVQSGRRYAKAERRAAADGATIGRTYPLPGYCK